MASSDTTEVRTGFFPVVAAVHDVHLERGGAAVLAAGRDLAVRQGGGQVLAAARDLRVEQGGGSLLVAGGDLDVHQGGGGVLAARRATVRGGTVGVLLAREASLEDSRVLLRPGAAAAVCALLGVVVGLWIARARARRSAEETAPDA